MPAIELNTMQPDAPYNYAMEKSMFKLWLVLTTNQYLVGDGVKIFSQTADARVFVDAQAESQEKIYYVDVQKLATQLSPLNHDEVTAAFTSMMTTNRKFLQKAANLYFNFAANSCEYGPFGCITMQKALGIADPVSEGEEAEFLAEKSQTKLT